MSKMEDVQQDRAFNELLSLLTMKGDTLFHKLSPFCTIN